MERRRNADRNRLQRQRRHDLGCARRPTAEGDRTPAPITVLQFTGHVLLVGSGGHARLVYGTHGTTRVVRVGGAVTAAALTSDKRNVAVAWKRAGHVTTQLIAIESHRALKTLPEKGIAVVLFSPRGLLATGSTDKTVRLWRPNGHLVHVLSQRGYILGLTSWGARTRSSCGGEFVFVNEAAGRSRRYT